MDEYCLFGANSGMEQSHLRILLLNLPIIIDNDRRLSWNCVGLEDQSRILSELRSWWGTSVETLSLSYRAQPSSSPFYFFCSFGQSVSRRCLNGQSYEKWTISRYLFYKMKSVRAFGTLTHFQFQSNLSMRPFTCISLEDMMSLSIHVPWPED